MSAIKSSLRAVILASVASLASAFRNPRSLAFLSSTRYAVFRSGITQRMLRLGTESGSGSASESFFINERMLCSTSAADATAPRIASRSDHSPGAGGAPRSARIVDLMEPVMPEIEPERLEQLPLEERAGALEDIERRLRFFMDDAAA